MYRGPLLMSVTEVTAVIGAVSGLSGLALGILNFLHQRNTSRPRIVIQLHAPSIRDTETPQRKKMPGVVIVRNVGHVPVVMSPYLMFRPKRAKTGGYMVKLAPSDGIESADELKPQHSIALWFDMDDLPEGRELDHVYMFNEVREVFKPSRHEMRRFARNMRKLAEQRKPTST